LKNQILTATIINKTAIILNIKEMMKHGILMVDAHANAEHLFLLSSTKTQKANGLDGLLSV